MAVSILPVAVSLYDCIEQLEEIGWGRGLCARNWMGSSCWSLKTSNALGCDVWALRLRMRQVRLEVWNWIRVYKFWTLMFKVFLPRHPELDLGLRLQPQVTGSILEVKVLVLEQA